MSDFTSEHHSFILRFWRSHHTPQLPTFAWRGKVTHIPTNESAYIQDFTDLTVFLRRWLDEEIGEEKEFFDQPDGKLGRTP